MTRRRRFLVLGAMLVAVFAFGYLVGTLNASHPEVLVGSGYVGSDVASLQVGDTWYGVRSSVSWTDNQGVFHDGGWPDCLPHLREVSGIRFAAEIRRVAGHGSADIVWVDCTPR